MCKQRRESIKGVPSPSETILTTLVEDRIALHVKTFCIIDNVGN